MLVVLHSWGPPPLGIGGWAVTMRSLSLVPLLWELESGHLGVRLQVSPHWDLGSEPGLEMSQALRTGGVP